MTRMYSETEGNSAVCAYSSLVYGAYQTLADIRRGKSVRIDGDHLDIPSVVAVSRCGLFITIPFVQCQHPTEPASPAKDTASHLDSMTMRSSGAA